MILTKFQPAINLITKIQALTAKYISQIYFFLIFENHRLIEEASLNEDDERYSGRNKSLD